MPALDDVLTQKIQLLEAKALKRTLAASLRHDGVLVTRGGKTLVSFSCNDYLGLSRHPRVVAAAKAALDEYGAGAGASRLVTGEVPLYGVLENALAQYKKTESALVFGSGYLANLGTIPALVGKGDLIIADKLVHACVIDAAKLSGATLLRFAHNNAEHCNILLEANRGEHANCLILTETVFSMDGDRAPLAALSGLAKKYDAWLMTDDAHGLGVITDANPADIQMGTFSKAAGGYGGYVAGSHTLGEYLATAARSIIYTTGLPPATLAGNLEALKLMKEEPQHGQKVLENARYFTEKLGLPQAQSAIVPLQLGDNEKALAAAKLLFENGFLVTAIRPPTVPENTARLRFAFSALHTREQIDALAAIIRTQGFV